MAQQACALKLHGEPKEKETTLGDRKQKADMAYRQAISGSEVIACSGSYSHLLPWLLTTTTFPSSKSKKQIDSFKKSANGTHYQLYRFYPTKTFK